MITDWKPFQLNSGWSLEKERVIPRHDRMPLKNYRIYCTSESDELYNYWRPVLTAAQACLLKPKKSMDFLCIFYVNFFSDWWFICKAWVFFNTEPGYLPPDVDVLVTDATCSPELLDLANETLVPTVKPEWLVQTIITGVKADFMGHEKYRVTPMDEETIDEAE